MLLQALYEYAQDENLVEAIELTDRTIHLILVLDDDGSIDPAHPWRLLTSPSKNPKKGETKEVPGQSMRMPRFPGENNGGKAHFLADTCGPLLGVDPKTGKALPDDPKQGKNGTKAFLHFWNRIKTARDETSLPGLKALLAFRDRYLSDHDKRLVLPFLGTALVGKKATPTFSALGLDEPYPIEGKTIGFSVGGLPLFAPDSPLHDYWKSAYRREMFTEADDSGAGTKGGFCLVTGLDGQPIAESHKPEIKGVPGLPPKGGYLVSFAKEAPALSSYGFEGGRNAPVSEQAVAAYALGLNDLLRRDKPFARTINNEFVVCAWVRKDPDLSKKINGITIEPTDDKIRDFFNAFESGEPYHTLLPRHYHSLTLAANGGRVVVRRWLDQPLDEVVKNLRAWFHDLEIETIPSKFTGLPYRSIHSLAWTTDRTPSDVRSDVYDALYRAALEGSNPVSLLPSILQRLRIAAVKSGANVCFESSRFALIKLILKRFESSPMTTQEQTCEPMTIKKEICETNNRPYNCGRLLAVLDEIQHKAQGDLGADILARYYGNASTFPGNVFPRLLRLSRAHLNKIKRDEPAAGYALETKINDVCALFSRLKSDSPEFPGQLDIFDQGRFALGFHQQKAHDQRAREERKAAKAKSEK
jgi:CRISPR-associated protein Cas8c/Csd1 subtype I-C